MSRCLALLCCIGSLERSIAVWLSPRMTVGSFCSNPNSVRNFRIQQASVPALNCPIYSASVVDVAMVDWRFDDQEIGPFASQNIYPEVDFLSCLTIVPP